VSQHRKENTIAGSIDKSLSVKYYRVGVTAEGKTRYFKAHHISWFLATGTWPLKELDHKDRDGLNNTPSNLREATVFINAQNKGVVCSNTSGIKGVGYCPKYNGWQANITSGGERKNKYFRLPAIGAAIQWREDMQSKLHVGFS
jgi:hypothetical protein